VRRLVVLLALAATATGATLGVELARAADECRGLQVCLPVPGPWVVIPARAGTEPARVEFELRCPLRGYIVAGTDARLADPDIDVFIRGETGSPVGPGVTTSSAVVFVGVYAGERRAPTAFRPFIGCVPTSGGGGRALTSTHGPSSGKALRPTRPVTYRAALRRVPTGGRVEIVARCRARETAVDATHAVAFRTPAPPSRALIGSITASHRVVRDRAVATASASAQLPGGVRAVVQVIAHCRKDAR
jgi:hypothetical protein